MDYNSLIYIAYELMIVDKI